MIKTLINTKNVYGNMRNCVKTHLVVDEINSSRVGDSSMVVRCCCLVDSLSIVSIFEVDRVTDTFPSEVPFLLRGVKTDPKDSSMFAI